MLLVLYLLCVCPKTGWGATWVVAKKKKQEGCEGAGRQKKKYSSMEGEERGEVVHTFADGSK